MSLFAGTAENYRRFRSGVPDVVAQVLRRAVRTPAGERRLLDLGTGTGLVVQALGEHFDEVIAVDPDPDLLRVAEADLASRNGLNLRLVLSTAEDFEPPDGWRADLVTICRAFHWMDQGRVLRRLDPAVAVGGTVAIFGDSSVWSSSTPWKAAMRELVQEFLGRERRAGSGIYRHHDRPYREILEESAFSLVEERWIPVVRERTIESVIGYLHSMSFAAPRLFGSRLPEFDEAARARLAVFADDGKLVDDNEFHLLLARRPVR